MWWNIEFHTNFQELWKVYWQKNNSMTNAISLNPQQTRQADCCCTFLSPPPGLCLMFAVDPTLDLALISIFWSRICNRGNYSVKEGNRGMSYFPLYSQLAKWSNSSLRLVWDGIWDTRILSDLVELNCVSKIEKFL